MFVIYLHFIINILFHWNSLVRGNKRCIPWVVFELFTEHVISQFYLVFISRISIFDIYSPYPVIIRYEMYFHILSIELPIQAFFCDIIFESFGFQCSYHVLFSTIYRNTKKPNCILRKHFDCNTSKNKNNNQLFHSMNIISGPTPAPVNAQKESVELISFIPKEVVVKPGRRQMTSNTPHLYRYEV